MKADVPETLKADLPQSIWGKILSATPVVLAVVATMLAGLASSEMTKAQYDRAYAAQLQSRAGDQWNFFQAKRLRSALQNNTLDLLLASGERRVFDIALLRKAVGNNRGSTSLDSPGSEQALAVLRDGTLPKPPAPSPLDPAIQAVLSAIESRKTEEEISVLVGKVDNKTLDLAVRAAREQAHALDVALKPIGQVVDALDDAVSAGTSIDAGVRRDFTAARLNYNARRYDAEARLNQNVAVLFELQVRKTNLSAERHHRRSQRFFFGMLAAQTGVIVSTLAIAARKRNLLWALAAVAGAVAIAFAIYVYLFV